MEDLPVIVIRFALYADLMVMAGLAAFPSYALQAEERANGVLPLARPALVLSLAGLAFSGLGMLALVASMTGSSLTEVDGETMREIVGETAIGTAWLVRMAAMTAAVLSALALRRWPSAARLALLSTAALATATLVWTGHAGATEGWMGTFHRLSDVVHLLAAAVWIGGIAAFSWLLFRPVGRLASDHHSTVHRALEKFALVGTLAVAAIVATGVINSLILIGLPSPAQLLGSLYGRLLLAKLGVFGAMLLLAAANRWHLTPTLGVAVRAADTTPAVRSLRRSLIIEFGAALAVLALVAWLGTLEPPPQ